MTIQNRFFQLLFAMLICVHSPVIASDCDEYIDEAGAMSGVVPRFNENGSIRSLLAYGEGTFLTPKRSLISAARRKAELDAKRAFSAFFNESVSASSLAASLLEQAELTDQSGMTEGVAVELNTIVESVQSDTSSAISGMIKLDECVDTVDNFVLVTMGWKPKNDTAKQSQDNTQEESVNSEVGKTKVVSYEQEGEGCEPGINLVTLTTNGYGNTQNFAVDDAIRLAISQVYGEVFASSMVSAEATASAENVDENGNTSGSASAASSTAQVTSSSTSGVVDSYSIITIESKGGEFEAEVKVKLPKYCLPVNDKSKKKTVILPPKVLGLQVWTDTGIKLSEMIQREVEALLNETINLSVLDRSHRIDGDQELSSLSGSDFARTEAAKIGNKLGADYLVVIEFSDFETTSKNIRIGSSGNRRLFVTTANAWVKVIDVVTTNMVASIRVPLTSKSMKESGGAEAFAITMAHNVSVVVGERIGGGFNSNGLKVLEASSKKIDNFSAARDRLKAKQKEIEDSVSDDW